VVRTEFAEEHPDQVEAFLQEYEASVNYVLQNTEEAAELIGNYEIVAAAVAQKALPYCNITFMSGAEMKAAVSGYLQTLYDQNPAAVGGAMPGDDFYYGA
jgi:NitT/TauT family transport system substrate-binding protein